MLSSVHAASRRGIGQARRPGRRFPGHGGFRQGAPGRPNGATPFLRHGIGSGWRGKLHLEGRSAWGSRSPRVHAAELTPEETPAPAPADGPVHVRATT